MDKTSMNPSPPLLGMPAANVPTNTKLKSAESPVTIYNHCSPHGALSNSTNNGMVPTYVGFNQDMKRDDVSISKNGSNNPSIDSSSHNSDLKEPTMVTTTAPAGIAMSHRPSVGIVNNSKKEGLKITIKTNPQTEARVLNNCTPSPNGIKGASLPYRRDLQTSREKTNAHEPVKNSTLLRSLSASKTGRGPNNLMFSQQRRSTLDAAPHMSPGGRGPNKHGDKLRHSPRNPEFEHRGASDLDSPYPSPLSNEPIGNVGSLRSKAKPFAHDGVSKGVANSHISRTSSCNSVSDSSLTSNDTNDENNRTPAPSSENAASSFLPPLSENNHELNIEGSLVASPNTYDSAIINELQDIADDSNNDLDHSKISFEDVENFQFPGVNGSGVISPEDLNLSAEDIQQTLNSVSAESALPDLNSITNDSSTFNERLLGQDNSLSNFNSPSTPLNTTSSVTVTTAVSAVVSMSTTSSQPPLPASLSSPSQNTTNSSFGRENFSTSFPTTSSHSQLEEILGSHDTEKLKNMSRPVGTSQFPASTSFNTSTTTFPSDAPNGHHHPPSDMPPSRRFAPPNQPGYVPRHMMRMPNAGGFPGPGPNMGFEGGNPGGGFMEAGPRPGLHFDQVPSSPHHSMPPYNMMSPQWQRPGSVGSMMSPLGPMMDGSKSPRGFPPRHERPDPMSRLQSTVNSIPESFMGNDYGSLTKNNNNNMGPPSMGEFPPMMSPTGRVMFPPPSPVADKRTMSADGPLASGGKTKGKRERGLSVDLKDGEKKGKDSGPKPKRRKSKSKDENKKADTKSRLSSSSDNQGNSYVYIFNTEDANAAANMVSQKKSPSLINYHNKFKGNCPLKPSLSNLISNNGTKIDTKGPFPGTVSPLRLNKSDTNNQSSPRGRKSEESKSLDQFLKQEAATVTSQNQTPISNASAASKNEPHPAQNLSDGQLRHRKEALSKLSQIGQRFLPSYQGENSGPMSNPNSSSAPNFPMSHQVRPAGNTYAMTKHLEKVKQELDNPVSGNDDNQWFKLVKAYNEKKKRMRTQVRPGANPENLPMDPEPPPPPYNGPSRWIGPGAIREPMMPGPDPMVPNQRFPSQMGMRGPMRLPPGEPHFPPGYMHNRFPRGYMVPPGGSRMHMYPGSGPQQGHMMGAGITRPPRLPPQHPMGGHINESYPFSEKLKEQASLYRGEGMHPQNPQMGFDISNPGDPSMGPRINSAEWNYGNPNLPPHPNNRLSHMPETISPSHNPMGGPPGGMMMSSGGPNQPIDPNLDNRLTPGMDIRMSNPYMQNFPNKHPLPNYPENSMGPPLSQQDLRPQLPGEMGPGMMMMDAMARRGESRPPDINIPRSPLGFPGRHPTPTSLPHNNNPNMMNPAHFNMDILPQVSPHHNPRSPMMNNSPQMMKSPMVGQFIGGGMGHNNMEGMGPTSAGAQPSDWGQLPQSMPPQCAPSSGGMMPQRPQSSVLSTMINHVNNIPLPMQSPLYQDAVKDTASPPPLSHINNNNGQMMQEPPPLTHNPMDPMPNMGGSRNPAMMSHPVGPPSYDPPMNPGPRPRMVGPIMGEGYPVDFRPPSHPGVMCMSPTMQGGQNMMAPQGNMMDMPPSGYIPNMPGAGGSHPGNHPNPGGPPGGQMGQGGPNRGGIMEFDLTGIIPSEKPSQTLSYFPPTNPDKLGDMRSSPSMAPTNRFPMSQRPMTPGGNNFNNPGMRPPGNFMGGGGNPPSYPGNEGYMSPSWENSRGHMMPGGAQMHPNFPMNRSMM